MFSQKITQLSLRLFYDNSGSQLKDKVTQQELSNTLSEFSTVHYSLSAPKTDGKGSNPLNDSTSYAIYASIEDARLRLISNAYSIGFDGEHERSRLSMLFADQKTFLAGMNAIVNHYEENSNAQNNRLIMLNRTLLVISISLMVFIAVFIMFPMIRKMESYTFKLRNLNDNFRTSNEQLESAQDKLVTQINAMESITSALDISALVSVTDEKGKILDANSRFEQISGYKKEELIGQNHKIVNSGYHDKTFWKEMWQTIGKGKIWRGLVKNKSKDGDFYWVDSTITPLKDAHGKIERYLSIRHDVTKRIQYEEELKSAKERAEAANVAKSSFLANMSHEIRTPLNSVIGFTDLLLKTKLNNTQQQYMSLIHQSGNILLDLINDILDFSKIEAGKLELSYERTDLWELVSQVADIVKYKVNEKGINGGANTK